MSDDLTPPHWGAPAPYVSPYGKPRGIAARLASWVRRLSSTEEYRPWLGTGIIEDLRFMADLLNRREWLEAMRLSDNPQVAEFARELLEDIDELETVEYAASHVQGLPEETHALPGVETIERLDAKAAALAKVRAALVKLGVADETTTDDELADFVLVLFA